MRANYRTMKITKHSKLQNIEIQNVESYRMAKYKTSNLTEWSKTKRQILQKGERQNVNSYRTAKDEMSKITERLNTKCQKYKMAKDPKQRKKKKLYWTIYENHLFNTTQQLTKLYRYYLY
jgi:hypothetical protein